MFAGQRQSVDNRSQFLPNHQHHNANDAVNDDCDSGGNHASTDEHLLFGDGGGFFGPVTPLSPSSEALDPQILLLPRTNQQSANNFMLSPSLIAAGAGAGVSGMDRSPGSSVLRSMISECLVPFSPFPSATAGTWLVSSPPDAIQSVISTSQPTAVRDMNDSFRHLYNIFSSSTFTSSTTTAAAASSSSSSTSSSASSSSSSSTALSTPDGGSLFQPNDSDTLPPSNGGGKKKRNKAYHCENCFVEHAPTWRKSPTGGRLCNACGLYLVRLVELFTLICQLQKYPRSYMENTVDWRISTDVFEWNGQRKGNIPF